MHKCKRSADPIRQNRTPHPKQQNKRTAERLQRNLLPALAPAHRASEARKPVLITWGFKPAPVGRRGALREVEGGGGEGRCCVNGCLCDIGVVGLGRGTAWEKEVVEAVRRVDRLVQEAKQPTVTCDSASSVGGGERLERRGEDGGVVGDAVREADVGEVGRGFEELVRAAAPSALLLARAGDKTIAHFNAKNAAFWPWPSYLNTFLRDSFSTQDSYC